MYQADAPFEYLGRVSCEAADHWQVDLPTDTEHTARLPAAYLTRGEALRALAEAHKPDTTPA